MFVCMMGKRVADAWMQGIGIIDSRIQMITRASTHWFEGGACGVRVAAAGVEGHGPRGGGGSGGRADARGERVGHRGELLL